MTNASRGIVFSSRYEWLAAVVLVAGAAGGRWALADVPNVSPVAAVALFAGFVFRRLWLGAAVPLAAMALSDLSIGGYAPALMATVYTMLAFPALLGYGLARWRRPGDALSLPAAAGCAVAGSVAFFLVTNFVCWWGSPWYPQTLAGLTQCYAAAVPFFRATLLGDLGFAVALFGGLFAWVRLTQSGVAWATE